jgi:hypothetical protein
LIFVPWEAAGQGFLKDLQKRLRIPGNLSYNGIVRIRQLSGARRAQS